MDVGNLHFTGDLVHVVGTNIDCRGRSCPTHAPRPCGSALRVDDWVVFRLVNLDDEGLDEEAIEVRRIVQGQVLACWISPALLCSSLRAIQWQVCTN